MPEEVTVGLLLVRRWRVDDLDQMMEVIRASQPELGRWLAVFASMPSRDTQAAFLESTKVDFDADRRYDFAVEANGAIVGAAGIVPNGTRVAIGYWAATSHTGMGQTTAVVERLTTIAFTHLAAETVEIKVDATNHASAAIPARLGYRLVGGARRAVLCEGHTGWALVWETDRGSGPARSALVIRTAEAAELGALVGALGGGDYLTSRLDEQAIGLTELILAIDEGAPVGEVCLRWGEHVEPEVAARLPGVPYLSDLEVAAGHRRRGIGVRLVLAGESRALARGAERIYVAVESDNQDARRLYERLGYFEWPHGSVQTPSSDTVGGVQSESRAVITVLVKTLRREGLRPEDS